MRQVYRLPSRGNATIVMNRTTMRIAQFLLDSGADVNAKDDRGDTPLHAAVAAQNQLGVKMLLGHQGCTNEKNDDGLTPLDMALSMYSQSTPEAQQVAAAFLNHIRLSE